MRYTMLALGLALLIPDVSQACHRRGACWGGNGCNGGWGRCSGGWGQCSGGWGGCHGGCQGGWARSGCYGGGYAYGGGYGGYANVNYSSPGYAYGDSYVGGAGSRTSAYYDPNMSMPDSAGMNSRIARVEVIVADPNAELIIQGQRMSSQGRNRFFVSPELESGKTYTYTIALNRPGDTASQETRKIDVRAGQNLVVDFTRSDSQNRSDTIRPADENRVPPPANPIPNPPGGTNPNPGSTNPIPRTSPDAVVPPR